MILYVKEYESPHRRLRIKNKLRMVLFLLLILCILMVFLIPDKGAGQTNYTPLHVRYGDTYWGIAKELQEQGYKSKADIRKIVYELIQESGIQAHELKEGDTIYIPGMEGD